MPPVPTPSRAPRFPDPRSHRLRRTLVTGLAALAVLTALSGPVTAGADPAASTTTTTTSPAVTTHTGSAAVSPAVASVSAYWVVASDGGVFSFGGAPFYGSTGNIRLNQPMVAISATSPTDTGGYREVAADGGIFSYGDARFYGSTGGMHLNRPIVGMAPTADGRGYWLVASDGGLFAFGDAGFYGSTGGERLNQPVVGMAPTADGRGYWLVAADGGIFAFGDARYYGSTGGLRLVQPIVAMAPSQSHRGYWLVAADGGIFAFGDAGFYGSLGGVPQAHPIVSMTTTSDGRGYWFTNSNGAVTAFGDATYWGSTPQVLAAPVVGITTTRGNGSFTGSSYPSGSTGYDISNYQCGNYPPAPHTIGVVQVVGESFGSTNWCLAGEAAWAGGGLNLYVYLTFGEQANSGDPACVATADPAACNYGFNAGVDAFDKARAVGVDTAVPWWLDVECAQGCVPAWSTDLAANAALVQGALDGLHAQGLNSVGIYASPGVWSHIVGDYQPAVPYWVASWGIDPSVTCRNIHSLYSILPSGPVQMVQYASNVYDDDYAC